MDSRTVMFALHELEHVGWRTIKLISEQVQDWTVLLQMESGDLRRLGVMAKQSDVIFSGLRTDFAARRQQVYEAAGIKWITWLDDGYPPLLREIAAPPWVLYCQGNRSLLSSPALAVVGTRNPTVYGRMMADRLARGIAEAGFTVMSGMARGIDSAAHRGAVETTGATVAVLAGGLDRIYPPENRKLYARIVERGAAVSEFSLGTAVRANMFPLRNRIIAGLCLGTVVVEAAARSGSLITADLSLESSRDVYAVPGQATSIQSDGTHDLIRQGAKLVTSASDVLEDYKHLITSEKSTYIINNRTNHNAEADASLTMEERAVLALMSSEPLQIDQLLAASGMQFGQMHSILLSLLMKKLIAQLPGSAYVRLYRL